jgi:adenosylhomocysteine nucleosidase
MTSTIILMLFAIAQFERVGIMSAMDVELEKIQKSMQVVKTDTVAQRIFYVGEIEGKDCVGVNAGIGKVNAALTAEILILMYGVDAIIFSGVSGGIDPELNIGDIVISKRVIHHDLGKITPGGFVPWDIDGYQADRRLVDIAEDAAYDVEFDPLPQEFGKEERYVPQVTIGCVVTGDQFIASEEKRRWIEEIFQADCVEMEGAAVAQVCVIQNVPFVLIRCLSDLANEDADIDFEEFVKYAADNSSKIVKEMISRLEKR